LAGLVLVFPVFFSSKSDKSRILTSFFFAGAAAPLVVVLDFWMPLFYDFGRLLVRNSRGAIGLFLGIGS
jgi:hypothetical protein